MDDPLDERLAAVERALTDGDHDLTDLEAASETTARLDALEDEIETLDDRVAELEAATQALRGYVGNVRSVNEDVEQRATLALDKAETALAATETPQDASLRNEAGDTQPPQSSVTAEGHCERQPDDQHRQSTDPTALATGDRERATDGGQRAETTDAGILSRIRSLL
jgi:chromosome segregation ATPase